MLIHQIRLSNLLSFGPDSEELSLKNLNVIIGPNGSGKSNLIEAIGLLQAAPTTPSLSNPIRRGGGIIEWLWKGDKSPTAVIEAIIDNPRGIP
ncbi:MAG: AAA family ATPase, partial [Desulfobacteraceae bacterium]|nr:AAA family ATPase [Desulfobacteraceae bacterium]